MSEVRGNQAQILQPEDDELHDRERQRHHDEERAAAEPPHLAFDDGQGPVHGCLTAA